MIIVTGATGHLGRLVIENLLQRVPAGQIVAAGRNVEKIADLAARGVQVRVVDFDQPETLASAFEGATQVLLISSSEVGKRVVQHRNAIDAAKRAGASLLVYTSVLKADTAGHSLVGEHLATEKMVRESGVPFVILRNSWYIENYTEHLAPAFEHGAIFGSADDGRVGAATRADYAAAAAAVLTGSGHEGKTYELAGDEPFTIAELANEVSRASGRSVVYKDLPADDYRQVLTGAGLPAVFADLYVSADLAIARGELRTEGGDLRRLIGRPTTPLRDAIERALR
jgi:NAD(P)H dehydrogenase (quinone)